ncbi:MAG: tetratricopeptide repeat protein [Candidatus Melainabacteria bacterium]|nr:tetratricopeptide repeat protein [Candidatus Melainabacteria bacterium]
MNASLVTLMSESTAMDALPYLTAGDELYREHMDDRQSSNRLDDALNSYYQALEMSPGNPMVIIRLAKVFLRKGNYQRAEQHVQQVLNSQTSPGWKIQSEAWFILGYIQYKRRAYASSIASLKNAIAKNPWQASRMHYCLQYAYRQQALQLNNPLEMLRNGVLAVVHLLLAGVQLPLETERMSLSQATQLVTGVLGVLVKELLGDEDGALSTTYKLYQRFPGFSPLMNMLASYYQERSRTQDALFWYRKASERDPLNEDALFNLGKLYESENQPDLAIQSYLMTLSLRPDDPGVLCQLGNVFYTVKDYEQAASCYKASLFLSRDPEWRATMAQSLADLYQQHLNQPVAAQMALMMAIQQKPDAVDHFVQLGVLNYESNDLPNARRVCEKALTVSPKNPQLHSHLGYLHWTHGHIEKAVQFYQKAIALDPSYDIAHNNLGVIYLDNLGQLTNALEHLEKATELNNTYALAFFNLGRAHNFLGNKLEAAAYYQRARELNEITRELDNDDLVARIQNLFNAGGSD